MKTKTGYGWLGGLVVAILAGLGWQRLALAPLRAELAALRGQQGELAQARAENERLRAAQVSAARLESLRADHAALARLKAEIAGLRARAEVKPAAEPEVRPAPARFAADSTVPAAAWRNAGTATPPAALETALWAAAGGEVNAFASVLAFDATARPAAEALWAKVPAELRAQCDTPERLLAFLSVKDVPLGSARILAWMPDREERSTGVALVLSGPEGRVRNVTLVLDRQAEGWKLRMTGAAVAKYAAQLHGPAAPVGAK